MTVEQANHISIKEYLSALNLFSVKEKEHYGMYRSPFRSETEASFKVDYRQNLWHDFGTGEGGTMIDLVMKINQCTFHEAMQKLSAQVPNPESFSFHGKESSAESHICISEVLPLANSALTSYLAERKINLDTARQQCREIHYMVDGKAYFAIGFANDAGGYELRNKYFKGSVSPKGITTKSPGTDECIVFEGFIDYLSYLTLKQQQQPHTNMVILNSVNQLDKAMDFLNRHTIIHAFLDNDEAGKRTLAGIQNACKNVIDQSGYYWKNHIKLTPKNQIPSIQEFKDVFNDLNGKADDTQESADVKRSVSDYIDEFTKTMGRQNNWTNSTYAKFKTLKVHLNDFNKDIDVSTISETDLQDFVQYLFGLGMRNTTINKNVAFVRWFLRWAHKKGYYSGTLYETFKPKFKGVDGNSKEVIHLTWEELMHLLEFPIPESKQYLIRVRDVFCFTCFTGLRHSDVYKLRRSDVKPNHIEVVTQKTVDGLKIELNKYSRSILEKYTDFQFEDDKALPVISNVKMNVYLKELGEIAGINEPQRIVYFKGNERYEEVYPKYDLLTTHCGRRTFIVNALYLGIPSEVIMKWTGHNDFKAMKPYVKIVDALKANEMDKFNRV